MQMAPSARGAPNAGARFSTNITAEPRSPHGDRTSVLFAARVPRYSEFSSRSREPFRMSTEPVSISAPATCSQCGGTGWKNSADGRVARCDCRLRERADRQLRQARIPARYEHCDMREFAALNPSLAAAKLVASRFVEEYDATRPNDGLLLIGPIGVGKTHLAVAV